MLTKKSFIQQYLDAIISKQYILSDSERDDLSKAGRTIFTSARESILHNHPDITQPFIDQLLYYKSITKEEHELFIKDQAIVLGKK